MLIAIIAITLLAAVFGLLLGYANIRFHVEGDPITDQIEKILPQTQCGQCGFAGCRPYAEAIAAGEADINRCPPGGEAGIMALSDLLGIDAKPLCEEVGEVKEKHIAHIDEQTCIGCTLCMQACPVDAILGAAKHMHTIIAQECTGCEKCIEPCPVDCITMVPVKAHPSTWKWPLPEPNVMEKRPA